MLPTTVRGYQRLKQGIKREKALALAIQILEYIAITIVFVFGVIKF